MDDRNGTEHADWLMRGRMAFCRAYPGQIALIIFPPSIIRTTTKKCGHAGPSNCARKRPRGVFLYIRLPWYRLYIYTTRAGQEIAKKARSEQSLKTW